MSFSFLHKIKLVIYMINSILVIIGTIIGAGFASGKEIFTFFNVYGVFGFTRVNTYRVCY